jgi:hypothetical protein
VTAAVVIAASLVAWFAFLRKPFARWCWRAERDYELMLEARALERAEGHQSNGDMERGQHYRDIAWRHHIRAAEIDLYLEELDA